MTISEEKAKQASVAEELRQLVETWNTRALDAGQGGEAGGIIECADALEQWLDARRVDLMQTHKDSEGVDYVSVEELARWLQTVEDSIAAECFGAPDGCSETRAYLYGEICSIRSIRKTVRSWSKESPSPAGAGT